MAPLNFYFMSLASSAGPVMLRVSMMMDIRTAFLVTLYLGDNHTHIAHNVMLQGEPTRLPSRKLSEDTCNKYRIYKDGDVLRFHYYTADGRLVGAKTKTKDKQFKYEGETPGTLFGQHLFPNKGKRVVITEGELDAASCYQAMPGWQMVSLLVEPPVPRKASRRLWNGFKDTMRYVSSLITMTRVTRLHRRQLACFHLARSPSPI